MTEPPVHILLAEANPDEARLATEILQASRRPCRVRCVSDGVETMAYLRREGPHAQAPRPRLILLDLALPPKSGRDVLAAIKSDDALKQIPVVVWSRSPTEADVHRAYDLKANCYIHIPADPDALRNAFRGLQEFWLQTVSLPLR